MLENSENVRNFCEDERFFAIIFVWSSWKAPFPTTSYLTKMQVYNLKLKGVFKNSFRYPPKVFRWILDNARILDNGVVREEKKETNAPFQILAKRCVSTTLK